MISNFKKSNVKSLIPDCANQTPDYYCTWQTQLYATSDGKPEMQRRMIGEKAMFEKEKPYGWAYFYENARKDLYFVMDDSWDVPLDGNRDYLGSLVLNEEKFPTFCADANPLKKLSDKMKEIGWKGLGGWVCAQESKLFFDGENPDEYWIDRLKMCQESGIRFLKVDWGQKKVDFEFRKNLVQLGKKYAPDITVENALVPEVIPFSDVYRTYDVPAIMSIPMTIERILSCIGADKPSGNASGLLNCEDEVYIAAACGFTMGVMRHPYKGAFPDGKSDMSFPECHRNLKSKMKEVERAVNWHKIAPAFSVGDKYFVSEESIHDYFEFKEPDKEIESWWFNVGGIDTCVKGNVLYKSAKACLSRGISLPEITPDELGNKPYVVAAKNPNGAISVATLGRTLGRKYYIPKCDITLNSEDCTIFGVFGEYRNLILRRSCPYENILIQDLAGGQVFDITDLVHKKDDCLIIPGDIIGKIGTIENPSDDTSEPGVVIKVI